MFMKRRIEEMTASFVAGYRCNGTVDWHQEDGQPYYPPTVNDAGAAAFALEVAKDLLGENQVRKGEGGGMADGRWKMGGLGFLGGGGDGGWEMGEGGSWGGGNGRWEMGGFGVLRGWEGWGLLDY